MKDWIVFDTLSVKTLLGATANFWLTMLVLISLQGHRWLKRYVIVTFILYWIITMITSDLLGDRIFVTLLLATALIFSFVRCRARS
ncbi:MAG: hypothetical protein C4334_12285 [Pyrinomonas sp.]|uniref:hypothetical protein n=1 Tax=Pyrinomonas sp. TaxID=2080306 RepID=UPI0033210A55